MRSPDLCGLWTYVSEEAVWHPERVFPTSLQLSEKELTVEVQEFFQVSEYDGAFSPQVLRDVDSVYLWEVVVDDVTEGANVLPLCGDQLLHDVTQLTVHRQFLMTCRASTGSLRDEDRPRHLWGFIS